MAILNSFNSLKPLCEQRDPACGDHVAAALASASRGFRATGLMAKSISAGKLLLANSDLPNAAPHKQAITLEIADQYFAIGVFDAAADYYERYAKERGTASAQASERAAFVRRAFKNLSTPPAQVSLHSKPSLCPSALSCGVRRLANEPRWAIAKP